LILEECSAQVVAQLAKSHCTDARNVGKKCAIHVEMEHRVKPVIANPKTGN
jgi:hypothetical protein